jgi:hypothetical protein
LFRRTFTDGDPDGPADGGASFAADIDAAPGDA